MRSSQGPLVGTNASSLQTTKSPLGLKQLSQQKKAELIKEHRRSAGLACEPPLPSHTARTLGTLGVWQTSVPSACLCAQSLQSLTLSNPKDCSPPGSIVYGILQARILEQVASPPPGALPNTGIEPRAPALQMDSLLLGKPSISYSPLQKPTYYCFRGGKI